MESLQDGFVDTWQTSYQDIFLSSGVTINLDANSNLIIRYGNRYNNYNITTLIPVPVPGIPGADGDIGPPGPQGPAAEPGEKGDTGDAGRGIETITQPNGPNTDLVRVNYTDATHDDFTLPNTSIWSIKPSTSVDIYYNQGKVAIGHSTPSEQFHIVGKSVMQYTTPAITNLFPESLIDASITTTNGTYQTQTVYKGRITDDGADVTNGILFYGDYVQGSALYPIPNKYGIYLQGANSNYLSGLTLGDASQYARVGVNVNPNAYPSDMAWGKEMTYYVPSFVNYTPKPNPSVASLSTRFNTSNYALAVNGNAVFNGGLYPIKDSVGFSDTPNVSLHRGYDLGGIGQRWGSLYISTNTIYMGDAIISYDSNTNGFNFIREDGSDEVDLSVKYVYTERIGVGSNPPEPTLAELDVRGEAYISGNVGIGTTTPIEKLHVNGCIKANCFIGDGSTLTGIDTNIQNIFNNSNIVISDAWIINETQDTIRYGGDLVVDEDVYVTGSLYQDIDTTDTSCGSIYGQIWNTVQAPNNGYTTNKKVMVDGNLYIRKNYYIGCNLTPTISGDIVSWSNISGGIRTNKNLYIQNDMYVRGSIYSFYDTTSKTVISNKDFLKVGHLNMTENMIEHKHLMTSLLNDLLPAGMVSFFGASTAPAGWLICNGASYSRTVYARLFAVIGTTYNYVASSTPATEFRVPDLRGEFLRGFDSAGGTARGNDPNTTWSEVASTTADSITMSALATNGEIGIGWLITSSVANVIPADTYVLTIGSTGTSITMTKAALATNTTQTITFTRVFGAGQQDAYQDHTHGVGTGSSFQGGGSATAVDGAGTNRYTSGSRNGVGYRNVSETRPKNTAMLPCIKY